MAGSSFGNIFRVTTWGESHGPAVGAVVDGVPAGIELTTEDIQKLLNRRKPGQSKFTTARAESDQVEILSGVFEGVTTGTPISLIVRNQDQKSRDYSNIATTFRPGHADYGFYAKYGIRDYRGGGRSSGRETIGRVAAGAVAMKLLEELGIQVRAYTKSIGPISIETFDEASMWENSLYMPDAIAAKEAEAYLQECIKDQDSSGGVIACRITGVPAGIGDPVFEKLNANLAKAVMSIGAVKGFSIGDGFEVASMKGSENNDPFAIQDGKVVTTTNHAGGILGGFSNGNTITFEAAFKPTPSISREQKTVGEDGVDKTITIHGRHDPIIVPRAVVVVESMAAIAIADGLLMNMSAQLSGIKDFYSK